MLGKIWLGWLKWLCYLGSCMYLVGAITFVVGLCEQEFPKIVMGLVAVLLGWGLNSWMDKRVKLREATAIVIPALKPQPRTRVVPLPE